MAPAQLDDLDPAVIEVMRQHRRMVQVQAAALFGLAVNSPKALKQIIDEMTPAEDLQRKQAMDFLAHMESLADGNS